MKPLQLSIIYDSCPVHAQTLAMAGIHVSFNKPFLASHCLHSTPDHRRTVVKVQYKCKSPAPCNAIVGAGMLGHVPEYVEADTHEGIDVDSTFDDGASCVSCCKKKGYL